MMLKDTSVYTEQTEWNIAKGGEAQTPKVRGFF